MIKLIFIILLMVTVRNTNMHNATVLDIEDILNYAPGIIGISENVNIVVSYFPAHIVLKHGDGMELDATVSKGFGGNYTVFINKNIPGPKAKRIIVHEMIHVKQMEDGDLEYLDRNMSKVKWKGKVYEGMTSRPWENGIDKKTYDVMKTIKNKSYK